MNNITIIRSNNEQIMAFWLNILYLITLNKLFYLKVVMYGFE